MKVHGIWFAAGGVWIVRDGGGGTGKEAILESSKTKLAVTADVTHVPKVNATCNLQNHPYCSTREYLTSSFAYGNQDRRDQKPYRSCCVILML
jgi:hypothetical protein